MSVSSIAFARDASNATASDASLSAIVAGLHRHPKELSPIYFYDSHGSELFERICQLPEYYLTRAETGILQRCAGELAALLGANALLVEIGSGASLKTTLVLDQLELPAGYVPVDISRSALDAAVLRLRRAYPGLAVVPLCVDFTAPLPRPISSAARTVIFFPGSTIGNFHRSAAIALLTRLREFAGRHGALVIGVDLVKDSARLVRAYDDRAGVTAQFNLNILAHLNRAYGSDFHLDGFKHHACWVACEQRIEMHLISRWLQQVHIGGETIAFATGEHLRTEICQKYTLSGFAELARQSGWEVQRVWSDPEGLFSMQYAAAAGPGYR